MNGLLSKNTIMGSAKRFAINSNNTLNCTGDIAYPSYKTRLKISRGDL